MAIEHVFDYIKHLRRLKPLWTTTSWQFSSEQSLKAPDGAWVRVSQPVAKVATVRVNR